MKKRAYPIAVLALGLLVSATVNGAPLRFHRYYTDNMVLQRDKPAQIKGWADAGARVTVTFGDQQKTATADPDGKWAVTLDPMPASATPRTLTAASSIGNRHSAIGNVLVGDVLVFARQSSIAVDLGTTDAGRKAAAAYRPAPQLRALRIETLPARDPQEELGKDATGGWAPVDAKNALALSGAAFYLARDLVKQLDVPLGLVDLHMGNHFGVAWLSPEALDESVSRFPDQRDMPWYREHFAAAADAWASGETEKKRDAYFEQTRHGRGRKPALGLSPLQQPQYPSTGYDAVIHPLRGIAVKGILLQLGNDYPWVTYAALRAAGKSTDRAELDRAWSQGYFIYKHGNRMTPYTLPLVPRDWRRAFGEKDLPIGWILPPGSDYYEYGIHNREVRELLRRTREAVAGVQLIMPGTANIPLSGQPADERLLADRCKHWVMGTLYGEPNVTPSGPVFASAETGMDEITVHFKEGTARGLKAQGAALEQFEVAGPDGDFAPGTARIAGNTVKLTSDKVPYIRFVRYNWKRKPDQELVNDAGLPALPFNNLADWSYLWWPPEPPVELPLEYHTLASHWPRRDVAIINGGNQLAGGDSQPNPNHLGPTGIISAPFGPNLYVHGTEPGSPADGKLFPGDLIYGVNGKEFGDDTYRELANAITRSESAAGGGKLSLGVRRKGKNIEVSLRLEVLGSYSATTPYYCPKSEKIVKRAEAWSIAHYRPKSGLPSEPTGMLDTDLLFLMATGAPDCQGLVRRAIYGKMAAMDPLKPPDPHQGAGNWALGYNAMLFGEYYLLTGDRNVLPYLKNQADWAAVTQIKPPGREPVPWEVAHYDDVIGGWRTKYNPTGADRWKSGYGLMAAAGMPCVIGMELAKEAGLRIDTAALQRGLEHFNKGRAEYGYVLYWYHPLRIEGPRPIDPAAEDRGMLWSMNGKLGTAAALFNLVDYPATTEICSRYCVYSFNNTRHGHGGMFFNNFWTPVGAFASGEKGFKYFMKGQTWWRELFRRYDGSFDQAGRGGVGVAYGLPYVAPARRLRILGAPRSGFGVNPPDVLKPALDAHRKRDYAGAERLIRTAMKETIIPAEELPTVEHLLQSAQMLKESVAHDLAYTEQQLEEGRYYQASMELPQLQGVVAADNPRLQAIVRALESPPGKERVEQSRREAADQQRALDQARETEQEPAEAGKPGAWVALTTEAGSDGKAEVPEDEATPWRMKVLEARNKAPDGWTRPGFGATGWDETTLPISWRVSHTALFRAKFNVADKQALDALRVNGLFMQQDNVEIFLNGALVAKLNNIGRGVSPLTFALTPYALEVLHNGENTVALVTTHGQRWGKVKGDYSTVHNSGLGFRLEARKARQDR